MHTVRIKLQQPANVWSQSWSTTCNQEIPRILRPKPLCALCGTLKFVPRDSQKIPIEVEVFLLLDADDRLNSLLGRYDFKPTDGPVADLLLRYNNYYLQPKNTGNRIQMIQSRHSCTRLMISTSQNWKERRPKKIWCWKCGEDYLSIWTEHRRWSARDSEKHGISWVSLDWEHQERSKACLVNLRVDDHEKIVKQLEGIKWPLSKEQFADIEELLYEISTAQQHFQKFKQLCDDLEVGQHTTCPLNHTDCRRVAHLVVQYTKRRDQDLGEGNNWACPGGKNLRWSCSGGSESRTRLNTWNEKTEREQAAKKEKDLARQNAGFQSSFDQLLYEYPIQHLGLLSQSSILILIRSVMVYTKREGVDLKNNRFLQTNLTRLLNIYFSKDRWLMGNPHQIIACPTGWTNATQDIPGDLRCARFHHHRCTGFRPPTVCV